MFFFLNILLKMNFFIFMYTKLKLIKKKSLILIPKILTNIADLLIPIFYTCVQKFTSVKEKILLYTIFNWFERKDYEYFSKPNLKTDACRPRVLMTYMNDNLAFIQSHICDPCYTLTSYKGFILAKTIEQYWELIDQFNIFIGKKPYLNVLICTRTNLSLKLHSEDFGPIWENSASTLVYMDIFDFFKFVVEKKWRTWDVHNTIVALYPPNVETLEGLEYLSKVANFLVWLENNPNFNWEEIDPFVREVFLSSITFLYTS